MSELIHGDALAVLAGLPEASIDAVVTDPPYGIGFQGHQWDQPGLAARPSGYSKVGSRTTIGRSAAVTAGSYDLSRPAQRAFQGWCEQWASLARRALKPGGHLVAFGSPRTWHRLAVGLEDAGLEYRDTLLWLFGGGLPKSKNLHGAHKGRGTALKPAWEPIVLARKPLAIRSVQRNTEAQGTGALGIDACRIGIEDRPRYESNCSGERGHRDTRIPRDGKDLHTGGGLASPVGRWPANVGLAHELGCTPAGCAHGCVVATLDEAVGARRAGGDQTGEEPSQLTRSVYRRMGRHSWFSYGDNGGPSRFYYSAKTSAGEREAGLREALPCADCGRLGTLTHSGEHGPAPCRRNIHPTVKPIELMRWLCRLVVPPCGTLLDPFAGSGTTLCAAQLEGLEYLAVEREPWPGSPNPQPYLQIAQARTAWWASQPRELDVEQIVAAGAERTRHAIGGQVSIDDLLTAQPLNRKESEPCL